MRRISRISFARNAVKRLESLKIKSMAYVNHTGGVKNTEQAIEFALKIESSNWNQSLLLDLYFGNFDFSSVFIFNILDLLTIW